MRGGGLVVVCVTVVLRGDCLSLVVGRIEVGESSASWSEPYARAAVNEWTRWAGSYPKPLMQNGVGVGEALG